MKKAKKSERGAALVTVLVMLSIMSALTIVAVDASRFSLRRTTNQAMIEQARWYLIGAESFASGRIAELGQRASALRMDQSEWQGREMVFPLDAGAMSVTLWDGSNCFNLNSLVERSEGGGGGYVMSARGFVQFARLLDLLDIRSPSGGGLVAPLVDWIDSDSAPSVGGAEMESYGGAAAPYEPANALIADVSELARVRGFTAEIVARLAPFVCVRADETPNLLNPNTLTPDQAPLLAMALGAGLNVSRARDVITARPRGGWSDIDAFFLDSRLSPLDVSEPTRAQFSLTSRYYVMGAQVSLGETRETSAALIDLGGRARVVRRLFGVGAGGRAL